MRYRDKCVASYIFFKNEGAGEAIVEPPEVNYKVSGNQGGFIKNKSYQTNLICSCDGTCGKGRKADRLF